MASNRNQPVPGRPGDIRHKELKKQGDIRIKMLRFVVVKVLLGACLLLSAAPAAWAAGGCGSVCLPLEALDPEKTQLRQGTLRVGVNYERAVFNNFREGSDSLPNPGGNKATITQAALFADYGVSEKFTASLMVPYVDKDQSTNRFGDRSAQGIGDVSLFGRYEIVSPELVSKPVLSLKGPSIALGLGIKFPTGSIKEPGGGPRLPPAFQAGSGAYDIVPTVSYFQDFGDYSLFGSAFARIPLEENNQGYKFGEEIELNVGGQYPLPGYPDLSLMLSLSMLYADNDKDTDGILPARLRDGQKVLNTGGRFIDIVPGLRWQATQKLSTQLRVAIPLYEDWNGERSIDVGQVAPDVTTMVTFTYNFGRIGQKKGQLEEL
jgi:hypothetical protein